VPARQVVKTVLRKGVLATLSCNQRCPVRLDLVVSRATQRAYKLSSRTVGTRTVTRTGGKGSYRISLKAAVRRKWSRLRSVGLTVRATWTGVQPRIVRSATVRLRR
jgi:hypothetical protein